MWLTFASQYLSVNIHRQSRIKPTAQFAGLWKVQPDAFSPKYPKYCFNPCFHTRITFLQRRFLERTHHIPAWSKGFTVVIIDDAFPNVGIIWRKKGCYEKSCSSHKSINQSLQYATHFQTWLWRVCEPRRAKLECYPLYFSLAMDPKPRHLKIAFGQLRTIIAGGIWGNQLSSFANNRSNVVCLSKLYRRRIAFTPSQVFSLAATKYIGDLLAWRHQLQDAFFVTFVEDQSRTQSVELRHVRIRHKRLGYQTYSRFSSSKDFDETQQSACLAWREAGVKMLHAPYVRNGPRGRWGSSVDLTLGFPAPFLSISWTD